MSGECFVTETGRVVRKVKASTDPGHRRAGRLLSLDGESIVGRASEKVTRYNLRRVFVVREWIVTGHPGGLPRVAARTRSAAVVEFMARLEDR